MVKWLWLMGLAATAALACDWDYPIWIQRSRSADPLYRFEKGNKAGYIDRSGKVVMPPVFDLRGNHGGEFHEGMLVKDSEVASERPLWTLKDAAVSRPAEGFSDGLARVVVEGSCVYASDTPCGSIIHVGDRAANAPLCQFAFIDKTGRVISQDRFDYARDFSEGLAPVRKDGRWGFIDKSGKLVIAYQFEDAQPFSDGLARVRQNGSYGYVDGQGKFVIPPWFEYAEDFSDGLAPAGNAEEGYWYINKSGQEAFPHRYLIASPFFKGLAHVQLLDENEEPGDFAYIDTTGKQVFAYQR